jgi:hypothetical protein
MCVTIGKSEMAQTRLFVGKAVHPGTGKVVHTLIYKNQVQNLASGGNAMILHLPTDEVEQENLLDLTTCPHVLGDMAFTREILLGASFDDDSSPKVFSVGSYHVVVSKRANTIATVLDQVPEERRPEVNQAILDWYDSTFEKGCFLLACFGGKGAMDAEPFGVWYEPWHPEILAVPCLDAHDGEPPQVGALVKRDHILFVGDATNDFTARLDSLPDIGGDDRGVVHAGWFFKVVEYSDELLPLQKALLPKYVKRFWLGGSRINGDIIVDLETATERVGLVHQSGPQFLN